MISETLPFLSMIAAVSHCFDIVDTDPRGCLMMTSGDTVYPLPPSITLIRNIRVVGLVTTVILAGLYSSPSGGGDSTVTISSCFISVLLYPRHYTKHEMI